MSRPISDIVRVDISVSALTPSTPSFNNGIIVGPTAPQTAGRVHSFSTLTDVAAEYATNTAEYLAATQYFGQTPRPATLLIGQRTEAASADGVTACFNALSEVLAGMGLNAYGWSLTSEASAAMHVAAAAWCEAASKAYFYTDREAAALLTNDSNNPVANDVAATMKALLYRHAFGVYSGSNNYAAMSAMSKALVTNYDQPNSVATMKFKQLPGTAADNLTSSQIAIVKAKNLNFYTIYGTMAMLAEGVAASGAFFDEVMGLDWLKAEMETNVFAVLAGAVTKIPQTDAGVGRLVQALDKAFNKALLNGLIAPGIWNGDNLGEKKNGDYLEKGYYIYAQPVAEQSTTDRGQRKAPPISWIACGAGAIHSSIIAGTFQS